MGMGFGESVGPDVPMDIEVGDHACINELALHKVAGKLDALRLDHLAGACELDLAGELRILAFLYGLDIIPKLLAVTLIRLGARAQHHQLGRTPCRESVCQ